jgi:ATP-binding cassette subfamily B protein RaxB
MPSLLLLDEATSQLDVNLEKTVNAAIRQTRVTRVIVAHRPETIKSADRVIELRGGRVVGTPALVLPTVMKRDPTPRFPGVR